MIRICFAEDDAVMAVQLRQFLDRYGAERSLELDVQGFASGEDLLRGYDNGCDILLLDVEMPGMDGMETARTLRERDAGVVIVFITNIARYAVEGYEVEALDFILKPVSYFAFSVKMDRAVRRARQQARHTVCLQLADGMQMLDTQDIHYLETQSRMLYYHTAKGVFKLRGSLSAAEKELAPWHFARCNQCYLVNLRYVSSVEQDKVQVAGHWLEISRRCKSAFLAAVAAYVGGGA